MFGVRQPIAIDTAAPDRRSAGRAADRIDGIDGIQTVGLQRGQRVAWRWCGWMPISRATLVTVNRFGSHTGPPESGSHAAVSGVSGRAWSRRRAVRLDRPIGVLIIHQLTRRRLPASAIATADECLRGMFARLAPSLVLLCVLADLAEV